MIGTACLEDILMPDPNRTVLCSVLRSGDEEGGAETGRWFFTFHLCLSAPCMPARPGQRTMRSGLQRVVKSQVQHPGSLLEGSIGFCCTDCRATGEPGLLDALLFTEMLRFIFLAPFPFVSVLRNASRGATHLPTGRTTLRM